jgi:hypothetical protein
MGVVCTAAVANRLFSPESLWPIIILRKRPDVDYLQNLWHHSREMDDERLKAYVNCWQIYQIDAFERIMPSLAQTDPTQTVISVGARTSITRGLSQRASLAMREDSTEQAMERDGHQSSGNSERDEEDVSEHHGVQQVHTTHNGAISFHKYFA